MLDIKFIRKNPDLIRETIKNKGIKDFPFDEFLEGDKRRSDLQRRIEQHRGLRNELSAAISKLSSGDERAKAIDEAKHVKEELQAMEKEFAELDATFSDLLLRIPNVTSSDMPAGKGEEDNEILKVWLPDKGYLDVASDTAYSDVSHMPEAPFLHKDHVDLGESLDIIDVKQSAKVSGARFCYLKKEAALLQDAIAHLLKKELVNRGFMPMVPPLLVREAALYGTSHFPEGKEDAYKIENFNVEDKNELYLVGSSEPANFSYFMDKTLAADELPVKLYAQTTCFRSEAGSWGRDVCGIKRVHQFDKIEMNALCAPDQSADIFAEFLGINEWLLQQLKLPYRVVNHCTGDSGYNASHLQCDVEVWRPGEQEFMEVMTDTNATDYQARRLNVRYKTQEGTAYVHTVNDTGCALGRMLIAIIENYQQEDGSIVVPEALRDYAGIERIIPKSTD